MMNSVFSLSDEEVRALDLYWRAANYLGAAQIYLRDNCLLTDRLRAKHIKPRLLGHWGTVPGINFVYTHLNRLIRRRRQSVLLVTGPGHGAPGNLANLYLEGTLAEFYPELSHDKAGAERFIRMFSTPGGFPSHLNPGTPGCIHEGGELGYALTTAFGAAFDNPDLLVACIVGDGEAETGPTATAWHCAKYLNPAKDGAVLPILHLNRYKISSVTVFGAMTDDELRDLFRGYGYTIEIIEAWGDTVDERAEAHRRMAAAVDDAYGAIGLIQEAARRGEIIPRPRWPMLILRSPKGWTCPKQVDGKPLEGTFRSHQVPIEEPQTNPEHLALLEQWLRSYGPEELFDARRRPRAQLLQTCPAGDLRMGMNVHANGGRLRRELSLPDFRAFGVEVKERGAKRERDTAKLGEYLREVVRRNAANFRIFCPDEMESNRLNAVFEVTDRQFVWSAGLLDDHIGRVGRVAERLVDAVYVGERKIAGRRSLSAPDSWLKQLLFFFGSAKLNEITKGRIEQFKLWLSQLPASSRSILAGIPPAVALKASGHASDEWKRYLNMTPDQLQTLFNPLEGQAVEDVKRYGLDVLQQLREALGYTDIANLIASLETREGMTIG